MTTADPMSIGFADDPAEGRVRNDAERRLPGLATASLASLGAGAIHAAAIGIHAEHPQLARVFVATAVLQLGLGLVGLLRPHRLVAVSLAAANAAAVGGWLVTRTVGISWIDGLEIAESPQFADSACALMGAVAVGLAAGALLVGWHPGRPVRLVAPGLAALALTVPAMVTAGTHVHSHDETTADHAHDEATVTGPIGELAAADDGHPHDDTAAHDTAAHDDTTGDAAGNSTSGDATATTVHAHDDTAGAGTGEGASAAAPVADDGHDHTTSAAAAPWPRPWSPTDPVDFSGIPGVSAEQQQRAEDLVEQSLVALPQYASVEAAKAAGYTSIGDAGTGSEHYIRYDLVQDDVLLDPNGPESLVYTVNGDQRTLAGAMYIASARAVDDPSLTEWAGPLMQWHNHGNLCWDRDDQGVNHVVGIVGADGTCSRGVNSGGANPMVHVWVTPHPCGVFAALEGVGAGQAAVPDDQRIDMCNAGHLHDTAATATPVPYDPTKPIDLSGTAGVTPEQQAAAENLVAVTLVRLPQWADPRDAEAAGFHSIGDGLTGFEHFINWDWINDDVTLDPDHPESLVYQPQPDGSRRLVSAMYMLPDTVALTDVPELGGALTQWHIHDNLCFTDGVAPTVAGLVDGQGNCRAGLVKFRPAPMIHVWIVAHPCGPFAALEGVGAGQIADGEERLCDHAHGSTGTTF